MYFQRAHRLGLIATAIVLVLSLSAAANELALPAPPKQSTSWAPPATTLPAAFVDACKALFEQGLADPRGCEYREVQLRVGSVGPAGKLLKTHAFVLPGKEGETRFAIGWNGLVYPVHQLGKEANLAGDIAEVVRQVEVKKRRGDRPVGGRGEADALSAFSNQPIKAALLLRLGQAKLAEKAWEVRDLYTSCENYQGLASHFHQLSLRQLTNAHQRGEDRLALVAAQRLAHFEKQARDHAERIGAAQQSILFEESKVAPLLADQRRRAIQRLKAKTEVRPTQISELIQNLENLTEIYNDDLRFSPAIQAVLDRGDEAVGPLLDCLEGDTRLSRVPQQCMYGPEARFYEVKQVSLLLLVRLLGIGDSQVPWLSPDDAESVATQRVTALRLIAAKTAGLSQAERWRYYLAEDGVSPEQWLEAAQRIVRPTDESHDHPSWIVIPARRPGERPTFSGESLRRLTDPSITQLLQTRIEQVRQRLLVHEQEVLSHSELGRVMVNLMHCLAQWEPKAARGPLKDTFTTLLDPRVEKRYQRFANPRYAENVARITLDRLAVQDADALPEYLTWLTQQIPEKLDSSDLHYIFQPLIQTADDDRTRKTADNLFNQEGSAWNPIYQPRKISGNFYYGQLIASPLIVLPSFREQLLRELDNRTPVASLKVTAPGTAEGKTPYNYSALSSPTNARDDARNTPVGESITLRPCDVYALSLSRLPGMPEFALLWTKEHRDVAIAECRRVLDRYGRQYRPDTAHGAMNAVKMIFPALAEVASQADVEAGRAIFTLANEGSRAVLPLKNHPLAATRHQAGQTTPDRGFVWQAEEAASGERYYGFVGARGMGKVPGIEIEFDSFTSGMPWGTLRAALVIRGQKPGVTPAQTLDTLVARPVQLELQIHNRRGAQQSVPTEWLRRADDKWQWREGVELRLLRRIKDTAGADYHESFAQDIVGRPLATFRPHADEPQQSLATEGTFQPATFKLQEWFEITEPGSYLFQMVLPSVAGKPPTVIGASFEVHPPSK